MKSWLEKHPNIVTIPVAILCIIPLISLFVFVYLLVQAKWLEKHPNIVTILCNLPWISLFACGYVLNQKNRSLAWLLLFFVVLPVFISAGIGVWIGTSFGWTWIVAFVIVMLPEKSLLTEEQVRAGLWLEREGHYLNLKRGDEFLETFNTKMTNKATIWQEAQKYV